MNDEIEFYKKAFESMGAEFRISATKTFGYYYCMSMIWNLEGQTQMIAIASNNTEGHRTELDAVKECYQLTHDSWVKCLGNWKEAV